MVTSNVIENCIGGVGTCPLAGLHCGKFASSGKLPDPPCTMTAELAGLKGGNGFPLLLEEFAMYRPSWTAMSTKPLTAHELASPVKVPRTNATIAPAGIDIELDTEAIPPGKPAPLGMVPFHVYSITWGDADGPCEFQLIIEPLAEQVGVIAPTLLSFPLVRQA
jgi:hypothetical protein